VCYFLIAGGEDYFAISAAFSHLLRLTSNGYGWTKSVYASLVEKEKRSIQLVRDRY